MDELILSFGKKCVAVGLLLKFLIKNRECGLDYDRFHYANKETQLL